MKPDQYLSGIFGQKTAYSGFVHPENQWITRNKAFLLALTGNQVVIAGDMPIFCAAGTVSEVSLELLIEAGFHLPGKILSYYDTEDYATQLNTLVQEGFQIAVQHLHLLDNLPPEKYVVPPDWLSWLNDKGNLAEIVPRENMPNRIVFQPYSPSPAHTVNAYPCLLKTATLQTTGGGTEDIFICQNRHELDRAITALGNSERLVLEEWLPAQRFLCLNYSVDQNANVSYIGATEIVNNSVGGYEGNWIGDDVRPLEMSVTLGEYIAKVGADKGYRGCLCVDMAELQDDRVIAFDLNFRSCGSTTPLLVFNAVKRATGASVARFRSWSWEAPFEELIDSARKAMQSGLIVPLSSFNPEIHGLNEPAKINAILLGNNRADVIQRNARLAAMGWH